jgi:hypothetical protein
MKKTHHFLTTLMFLLASFSALAEGQILSTSGLLEKSGINASIDSIAVGLKLGLKEAAAKGMPIKGKQLELVLDAVEDAYAGDKIRQRLAPRLESLFSLQEQKELLAFLDSPLGVRIVAAEKTLADEEVMLEVMKNGPQLVNEANKNSNRLSLIQSLNESMNGIEVAVDMAVNTSIAMDIAFINASNPPSKPSMDELIEHHEQSRYLMTPMMAQMVMAGSMHAYKDFTDVELNQYLAFAISPVGQKYFLGIAKELDAALKACGEDLGKLVSENAQSPV